jgi:uncharacterized PurR-regulated membrane protein YhhQ (DUF165 family)
VGLLVGLALATTVLAFNIQKCVVIAATALLGAGVIVGTFLFLFGDLTAADLGQNPVRHVLQTSPFWLVVFLAVLAGRVPRRRRRGRPGAVPVDPGLGGEGL